MAAALQRTRSQLVEWLSKTKFAGQELSPEFRKKCCEGLGITEELMVEAHMLRSGRDYREAASKGRHGDYVARKVNQQDGYHSVVVHLSPEAKRRVVAWCREERKVTAYVFMRTLIHHYLRGTWEPPDVVDNPEAWLDMTCGEAWTRESVLHAAVSQAAKQVFNERARALHTNSTLLMKTLFREAKLGRFALPGTVKFVEKAQMYSVVDKYIRPSSF